MACKVRKAGSVQNRKSTKTVRNGGDHSRIAESDDAFIGPRRNFNLKEDFEKKSLDAEELLNNLDAVLSASEKPDGFHEKAEIPSVDPFSITLSETPLLFIGDKRPPNRIFIDGLVHGMQRSHKGIYERVEPISYVSSLDLEKNDSEHSSTRAKFWSSNFQFDAGWLYIVIDRNNRYFKILSETNGHSDLFAILPSIPTIEIIGAHIVYPNGSFGPLIKNHKFRQPD